MVETVANESTDPAKGAAPTQGLSTAVKRKPDPGKANFPIFQEKPKI